MDLFDGFFDPTPRDVRQQHDVERNARRARRRARNSRLRMVRRIDELEERQAYFGLVMASILAALEEDGSLTRERLRTIMARLDAREGSAEASLDAVAESEGDASERETSGTARAKKGRSVTEGATAAARARARRRARRRRS